MQVPVLKQGDTLIAMVQAAVTDADLAKLKGELADKTVTFRCRGVILDVSLLDVIDSYAARTFRTIAQTVRLRGAEIVVVGIQPDIALAMSQLGLTLDDIETALDLDDGIEILNRKKGRPRES